MSTKPSYMSDSEFDKFKLGHTTTIGDYTIKPKLDFDKGGFRIKYEQVWVGWIITKDGCLATPGASWATTLHQAYKMVGALMASKGDPDVYHGLMMLVRGDQS